MLTAAREARGFVEGLSRETFLADRRTQQAVVMSLLIIGEAAAKIMDTEPAFVRAHPEVPWRNMRGMRNRMAHGYFETNYELGRETVSTEIPQSITEPSILLGKSVPDGAARQPPGNIQRRGWGPLSGPILQRPTKMS